MKNRFAFQPRYFLFWLLYFVLAKALFVVYHGSRLAGASAGTTVGIFSYGLRLDAAATAYLCAVPFLLFILGSLAGPRFPFERLIRLFTAILGIVVTLLTVADLELYRAWGFRLDATPLQYLSTPQEMAASAGSAPMALLLAVWLGLLALGWLLYRRVVGNVPALPPGFGRGRAALAGLLYLALLVVPMRGGLQQIPVNQSDVYFSARPFANHAAVNVPWNVINSLRLQNAGPNPYQFLPDSTAARLTRQLYAPAGPDTVALLRTTRPNVLFLILESFTGKLVGHLGGEAGVTPTLDSLSRVGVSFQHLYAAGDRSQKGLVALLSGYPNQPTTSIIKSPRKTEQLPHLARVLRAQGYSTAYYHGGELAFANMKSYLVTAGYERFTERADFARRDQNSKWGAHDHVLLARMLQELPRQRTPFFVTAFTLSSHEPFDVPMPTRFPGEDEAARFRNSVYYTDHVLGQFLRQARRQAWWDNTVVVVVADHGHHQPGDTPNHAPEKFRIPLLLTGGALRASARGRRIGTFGSQTDVAATLLTQLQLPVRGFPWSRDLLAPAPAAWPGGAAFYCFTDGFGVATPAGTVTFDNVARRPIERTGTPSEAQLQLGKAYEQTSFADFLQK
ncbi:phosphoglycerol transferase MdoB-like AlkP superfamily enzyme [Hymenobacter luteus]|uniref:Phosphoglycerol transferase MdoB-like AlkP superfamily enzyme n=2 Tax=Hymenobacter TaxID=89966 RepID=A0A7W9T3I6_9BACT|nr:LTA synthase family protein [Hymenobacter latericoloratus]MBB4601777.1 phosphoglycerol transferase MdoB-like AlkP superfamily enzyme [Hymenobacter latericoloratus]MBB6059794.1 phosphoglycerol transferase MdoB-like AlkP superfamily enzyme [Hymenobacter luteus]